MANRHQKYSRPGRHHQPRGAARRYLTCRFCFSHSCWEFGWAGDTILGRCPCCQSHQEFPICWPWLELAARSPWDILALLHRRSLAQ